MVAIMESNLYLLTFQLTILLCAQQILHARIILAHQKDLDWTEEPVNKSSTQVYNEILKKHVDNNNTDKNFTGKLDTFQTTLETNESNFSTLEMERQVRSDVGHSCRARMLSYDPITFTSQELFNDAGESPQAQANKRRQANPPYTGNAGYNHPTYGDFVIPQQCPHGYGFNDYAGMCVINSPPNHFHIDSNPHTTQQDHYAMNQYPHSNPGHHQNNIKFTENPQESDYSYKYIYGQEHYGAPLSHPQPVSYGYIPYYHNVAPQQSTNHAYESYNPTQQSHVANNYPHFSSQNSAYNTPPQNEHVDHGYKNADATESINTNETATDETYSEGTTISNNQIQANEIIIPSDGYILSGEYVLKRDSESHEKLQGDTNGMAIIDRIVIVNNGFIHKGNYMIGLHVQQGEVENNNYLRNFEEEKPVFEDAEHYYERIRKEGLMVSDNENESETEADITENKTNDSEPIMENLEYESNSKDGPPEIYMLQELDDKEIYDEDVEEGSRERRTLLCDPMMPSRFCPKKLKRSPQLVLLPLNLKLAAGVAKGVLQVATKMVKLKTDIKAAEIRNRADAAAAAMRRPPAPRPLPIPRPLIVPTPVVNRTPLLNSLGGNNFKHHHTTININAPHLHPPSLKVARNILDQPESRRVSQNDDHQPLKMYTNYYRHPSEHEPTCKLGLLNQKLRAMNDDLRSGDTKNVGSPAKIKHHIHKTNSILYEVPVIPPRR